MEDQKTITIFNQPEKIITELNYFSPSAIVAIFNAATITKEEKKIIRVRGIFKKTGTANYGGNYYNRLKDEASDSTITIIISSLIHNQLDDNSTIEFNGFITRRIDKLGRIELIINFIDLLDKRVNKFSEQDTKKILLINQKVLEGFKDLDAYLKNAIFNNNPITIKIIMGKSGIIHNDIKQGMEHALSLYNIEFHRISLSSPDEIINKILMLDETPADVICIARGGGDNLSIFEDLNICNSILNRKTIIASAIGHADDVSLFEKLSDKKFITPTHFGNYLKEIYNRTIEELENSKAKLVQVITNQLSANYDKQIQNLTEQLAVTRQQNHQMLNNTQTHHNEQLQALSNKLKMHEELENQYKADRTTLHAIEIINLKKQIQQLDVLHQNEVKQLNSFQSEKIFSLGYQIELLQTQQTQKDVLIEQSNNLASKYHNQLEVAISKKSINLLYFVIAIIIGIILGVIISRH